MAKGRPIKDKIDFAGWQVDMFDNDTRIDKLLDSPHGWLRFGVYFYLSQKANGTGGYYCSWSYGEAATMARKMGGSISSEIVSNTVSAYFEIGLFDKGLFEKYGILTSEDIQERYCVAAKSRKRLSVVIKEYWLLGGAENAKISFASAETIYDTAKVDYDPSKSNYDVTNVNYDLSKMNYDEKNPGEIELCGTVGKGRVEKGKEGVGKGSGSEGDPDYVSPKVDDAPAVGYEKPTGVTTTLTLTLQKGIYYFTQEQLKEYGSLYPDVDIAKDIDKIQEWLNNHPECRLSKKGVSKFVAKWMSETQEDEIKKKYSGAGNTHANNGRKSSFDVDEFFKLSVAKAMLPDD